MAQPFRPGELNEREARRLAEAIEKLDTRDGRLVLNAAANVPVRASNWTTLPGAGAISRALGGVLRSWFGATSTAKPVEQPKTLTPPPLPGTVSRPGAPPVQSIVRTPAETTITERVAEEEPEWEYIIGSSNVYAFRYDARTMDFYACFLGGTSKNRGGEGPTYRYKGVPKNVADRLLTANSAGGAVWDELRIRGTAYGHQFDYYLESTGPSGYVPRKETGAGLKPRRLVTPRGIVRSPKPGTGRFAGE